MELDNLTTLYVPPIRAQEKRLKEWQTLRQIVADLRGPNGCPWDKEQTHATLKKYAVEEVYELLQAIDEEDDDHIVEELGDVLLQVFLHAQIGEDSGYFSMEDVLNSISDKMIRRHPHVFGDVTANSTEDVHAQLATNKIRREKRARRVIIRRRNAFGFFASNIFQLSKESGESWF